MSDPRVSVVIPVYNREAYVGAAIESILGQTFTDFEVLVIDDGSTDRSRDVVDAFQDPRVRLVCHAGNHGIPKTRNTGVDAARGTYLAFLDSDDIAYPTRLAKQVRFLDRHPDHAAVGAWVDWMDATGRRLGRIKRWPTTAQEVAAQRLFWQGIENTASMARTAVLREYRHDERFAISEDFDLWARVASAHCVGNLPEVLVRRRAHDQQTNRDRDEATRRYRLAIYARQLTVLGVSFVDEDVERHYLLRRMRKIRFAPDRDYLNWAEAWLLTLHAANAGAACYPEPCFSHLLGGIWLKVCWHASTAVGWPTAWRRLRGSSLRQWVWPGLRREVSLKGPRPFAWLAAPRPTAGNEAAKGSARMAYLDYQRLATLDAAVFQAQKPYPWVNPEGLLTSAAYQRLVATLPDVSGFRPEFGIPRSHGQQPHDRYTLDYHKGIEIPDPWREFIAELRSKRYRRFLWRMFGRRFLWLSFYWHYTPHGCSVSPHCDAKRKLGSHIFYFNSSSDWDPAWGGQTLILDDHGRFDRASAPRFEDFGHVITPEALGNRSLLFARREKSWHGVRAVRCPENALRKVFIVVIDDWVLSLNRRIIGPLKGKRRVSY